MTEPFRNPENFQEPIRIRSDMTVEIYDSMGCDESITRAAMVSTGKDKTTLEDGKKIGLIKYLMANRHGSPFEHASMTFYIAAPIFVFREFQRHRIGFSYNEMSGRYTELKPDFYLPGVERPMLNIGTSARPKFQHLPVEAQLSFNYLTMRSYQQSWDSYKELLTLGVAKEIARAVLPVGIYSHMYVTCNPRSLMSFLTLRTTHPDSTFPSYPQYEIELVAKLMEEEFKKLFPATHEAFSLAGRVAP